MTAFESMLKSGLHIGKRIRRRFNVYSFEVEQHEDKSITVMQQSKIEKIPDTVDHLPSAVTTHDPHRIASVDELSYYRRAIRQDLFIGRMQKPLMLYTAFHFATKTPTLITHHLMSLNAATKLHQRTVPEIHFSQPLNSKEYILEVHRDTSMMQKNGDGAKGAFIIFRRCGDTVHPIHWRTRNLRHVVRSYSTAEIIAAAEAADSALLMAEILSELTYKHRVVLATDSQSLFNLATTTKEPEERCNKIDPTPIRETFDRRLLHSICWMPGHYMIKMNQDTDSLLLRILRECLCTIRPDSKDRITPKGEVG